MMPSLRHALRRAIGAIVIVALGGPAAHAGVWNEVATGLGAAGFDIRGGHNVLSGGTDILVTNTFQGQTFDFGAMELTLSGPISLDFSTGGRLLNNLDIALTTAATSDINATPLSYTLTYDVGGQQTDISGTLLIDAGISVNRLGWYDLSVDYSSRQTVVNDGRFANGDQNFDADFGPINIRGNIFADMLAAVTDPFFQSANIPNIFASFSGQARLKEIIDNRLSEAVAQIEASAVPSSDASALRAPYADLYGPIADATVGSGDRSSQPAVYSSFDQTGGATSPSGIGSQQSTPGGSTSVVPEPSVIILMLLGVPVILARRRRSTGR